MGLSQVMFYQVLGRVLGSPVGLQPPHLQKEKCPHKTAKKYKKYQVLSETLHKKIPYIWRHLTPQTRKKMILLAKKPIREINIQKFKYPDY